MNDFDDTVISELRVLNGEPEPHAPVTAWSDSSFACRQ